MSFSEQVSYQLPEGVRLRGGERLVWSGRPHQGFFAFQKLDMFLIPFSIFWFSFAIFWNVSVWLSSAPLPFRLFGLPFLVVGLYVTIGRFFQNRYRRSKIHYVLTNHRAIFVRDGSTRSIAEWPLRRDMATDVTTRGDGSGSFYFDPRELRTLSFGSAAAGLAIWSGPPVARYVFYRIDDIDFVAHHVHSIVYAPQD